MYSVSVYYKDRKTADIIVNEDNVIYKRYSEDIMSVPFMFEPTKEHIVEFIKSRCISKERVENTPGYLENLGLSSYEPLEIVKKTHGIMWEDYMWIKFPDDNITWEDVKVRD